MALPEQDRPRVVFIAGLGHSGTTLLDLMLGAHSKRVGLGEVDRTLANYRSSTPPPRESRGCACGKKKATTRRLCKFLDLAWEPSMLVLGRSRSHALRGNRMRFKAGESGLAYDWRWFNRSESYSPYLLCPGSRRLNRERVYSQ